MSFVGFGREGPNGYAYPCTQCARKGEQTLCPAFFVTMNQYRTKDGRYAYKCGVCSKASYVDGMKEKKVLISKPDREKTVGEPIRPLDDGLPAGLIEKLSRVRLGEKKFGGANAVLKEEGDWRMKGWFLLYLQCNI